MHVTERPGMGRRGAPCLELIEPQRQNAAVLVTAASIQDPVGARTRRKQVLEPVLDPGNRRASDAPQSPPACRKD
jgi:hypothetical protein